MSISRHQAVGAYRRWEPADFDDEAGARQRARPTAAPPAPPPVEPAPAAPAPDGLSLPADFHLPTADELARLHDEIRATGLEEGRREGYAEGLEAGRVQGYAEGKARAEDEAARLATLADGLEQALSQLDAEIAEELMALAIEMARRMVRQTLAAQPESILDTVRNALLQLPQGHAHIQLHPDDLALVREHLGEQLAHAGHRLQEDARLQRGDCRIDGVGAQVDATLETRWRRVLESIGHERAKWNPPPDEAGELPS